MCVTYQHQEKVDELWIKLTGLVQLGKFGPLGIAFTIVSLLPLRPTVILDDPLDGRLQQPRLNLPYELSLLIVELTIDTCLP